MDSLPLRSFSWLLYGHRVGSDTSISYSFSRIRLSVSFMEILFQQQHQQHQHQHQHQHQQQQRQQQQQQSLPASPVGLPSGEDFSFESFVYWTIILLNFVLFLFRLERAHIYRSYFCQLFSNMKKFAIFFNY